MATANIRPTSGWTDFQGKRHMAVRELIAALKPLPGTATLPVAWILELLSAEAAEADTIADPTVEDVAAEVGRSVSTVRGWANKIEGAYKLGRQWRIPRAALRAYLKSLAAPKKPMPTAAPPDLGSWRKHRKGEAA